MSGLDGELLANDQPATAVMLNSAWRWLQGMAATRGVETFIRVGNDYRVARVGIARPGRPGAAGLDRMHGWGKRIRPAGASAGPDPAAVGSAARPSAVGGSAGVHALRTMEQATDGLPGYIDCHVYDWREDGLYFFAETYQQDMQIRYSAFRAPLDPLNDAQMVEMMMCEDCLSARVAYEYASLRDATAAPRMATMATEAFEVIAQRSGRREGQANDSPAARGDGSALGTGGTGR